MTISIRPMSVDDLAQVYKLGLRCYEVQDRPYNYWSVREVADHLETHPQLCYFGEVVAFALGKKSYEVLESTGHLEWVAVAPEYRRQGLSSRLMETLLQVYWDLGKAWVVADVSSVNFASRGMARKLGFREGISVTFFVKELSQPQV